MERKLIFDIGFHKGEDTRYYLYRGYDVVAVDAAPDMIAQGKRMFSKEMDEGRLTLLNYIVAREKDTFPEFYISENSEWSSMRREIAERNGRQAKEVIRLTGKSLRELFNEHGVPYYCKIDIEGNDIIALESLITCEELPAFISVETECLGDNSAPEEHTFLTLDLLHRLGYRHFKLVDQQTLTVLDKHSFYGNTMVDPWKTNSEYARDILHVSASGTHFSEFLEGCSGPFGNDLAGRWVGYEEAKRLIDFHSREHRKHDLPVWAFWCDWHAALPHSVSDG